MALVTDGKPMTDKQALEVLTSLKLTIGRGNSKTIFNAIVLEAFSHAYKALEEKVEGKRYGSKYIMASEIIDDTKNYGKRYNPFPRGGKNENNN